MARKTLPERCEVLKLTQVLPGFYPERPTLGERFSFLCEAEVLSLRRGAWKLKFTVRVVDRVIFMADLKISPTSEGTWPKDRLTPDLLRSLPLDGLITAVRVWIATDGKPFGTDKAQAQMMRDTPEWLAWAEQRDQFAAELKEAKTAGRGRPRSRSDTELRSVAEDAISVAEQVGRGWLQELGRRRGELDPDGITVRQPLKDAIRDCRLRLEYLAPSPGRGSQAPPAPGVALLALWKNERDPRYSRWSQQLLTIEETP